MSSATEPAAGLPLRILCLDGGGVRGLSSLLVLERIMERIKESEGLLQVPRPCDRFGLIGGIGTGGIIAIMLGRLGMSVHDSIQAYKHLADSVFVPEPTPGTTSSSAFSGEKLEMAMKEIIRNNCRDPQCVRLRERNGPVTDINMCPHEDILFRDEHCTRTAVLAMSASKFDTRPTLLKTYGYSRYFRECTVSEVARATSAALAFFDSVKLSRHHIEFLDARYWYNNPCNQLISEAQKQFPVRQMVVLSIGTDIDDVVEITDVTVLEALSKMAATSKQTDLRLRDKHSGTAIYHRFNVERGLRDTKVCDLDKWGRIAAHTINYLEENEEPLKKFVTAFTMSNTPQLQINDEEKNKQCLSDFYVTDPSADKKDIESKKGGLLKDCYQWIVNHQDFQRFRTEKESRILWIKGDPGKGKTMLLCGIIDTLELDSSVDVSYFFCQAASSQLNTATAVLRGLIHELARRNPQLTKHVRAKYDCMGKTFFSNRNLWHSLCDILTALLKDPSLRNVILVVDALDECSVGRRDLLEFIAESSHAKWIVSSRNWRDIEEIMNDAEQEVKIHLDINQHSVCAAVDSYITLKVDQLARQKKYDDDLKLDILEYLRSNAEGTFLWVALVVQELSNENLQNWHALSELRSLPLGLHPLYERMQERISKLKDADVCKEIIATALAVYRPLTLEELHGLVKPLEVLKKDNIEKIIALCGSFLTLHDGVISFVHQSAKDYFLSKGSDETRASRLQNLHERVFLRSLDILHEKLKRDIYGLQAPGCLIDEVSVPKPDPLAAIRYSCTYWVDHLCDSGKTGSVGKSDRVLAFIKDKYLQWIEALSLLKNISVAERGIERLRLDFGESSKHLNDVMMDAGRFLLFHGEAIDIAPLQVYVSALIFSPTNSLIRRMFQHEEPDWIALKPKVGANWSACLRTFEGHTRPVASVMFSNDAQRLVSASGDKTIKIWDATSGTCLQTLEGHDEWVKSVVFSNDGQRLASVSGDKTVKIWDATSGACLHNLDGHTDLLKSVMFTNDGQRLASVSDDKIVKIWDATAGACLQTFGNYQMYVTSVAFSNDGQRLASASFDTTVKIWDASSGECLQTLKGHEYWVTFVVFSNDGQRLASVSSDKTVEIWDATAGTCLETLEGHHSAVRSLVFSNDGKRLASVSHEKTVKIWDATSGACLHTLEGHDEWVSSVVFSNDGQRLASVSTGNSVKVWDATSGGLLQTLEGHYSCVTSVAFSNDGQQLASGSSDCTVKIWDVTSGAFLQTLEGHDEQVTPVVFSDDGQRLASGSDDETATNWDATSGTCLQTLEGHNERVASVVFLNDGQQLASVSDDKKVKIWDTTSGACLQTFEVDDYWVESVVFTNDGQRLVTVSDDETLKIWDATSGACLQTLEGHHSDVRLLLFSNDAQRLALVSHLKTIKIWDTTSGACLQTFEVDDYWVESVVFTNDGQRLVTVSDDNTVKIWDATSGACLKTLEGHHSDVRLLLFSNDAQRLALVSHLKTIKIWDTTSDVSPLTLEGHDDWVSSVAFSNDGQRLASASWDKTAKIWDATTGACLQTLWDHDDRVLFVVFSIDGKRLASVSDDNIATIWDATSGECLYVLWGHRGSVSSVVFSIDGRRLASASEDKKVKIWDAISGACLQTLEGNRTHVTSLVFSNDGQRLASGSYDGTVKIWDAMLDS
ncbi:Vegetative incompatibility protein HET-E-1 [Ceratocystis fimbriata CBS 114723]|uniref:Mitochondrial division protein 1 n=1 Tax=Ceratocystis fimbriata CBS 114723 TaxID=1035309 RepID=A0A2C5WVN2_9PEZI|nr:Vegetative incompatibility protein HET-E-1 [Ceratocystis fimbriata CBS 114723]